MVVYSFWMLLEALERRLSAKQYLLTHVSGKIGRVAGTLDTHFDYCLTHHITPTFFVVAGLLLHVQALELLQH